MLRTIARDLGEARLQKLVSFYEGPDYAAFGALAARMEGKATPSRRRQGGAGEMLMAAYPLQAFLERLNRPKRSSPPTRGFMTAAMKCASEQMDALTAAGLKAN